MKKLGFLLLTLCLRFSANGQVNLVPNPGFEDTTNCPNGAIGAISYALHWYEATSGSADYFNTCGSNPSVPNNMFGHQTPHTGSAYAGIGIWAADSREYIQTQLDSALKSQHKYSVEFYVSMGDTTTVACNNIGMYLSDTLIDSSPTSLLNFTPQVSNNPLINPLTNKSGWVKVSGDFVAVGGEQYVAIGNFLNDTNSDTTAVGTGIEAFAYYYIDDVTVRDCTNDGISEINNQPSTIEISPNPATSEIKITTSNSVLKEAHIYSMMGQCILQSTINNSQSTIDISSLPAGMYIAEVITEKGVIRKRFVKQ